MRELDPKYIDWSKALSKWGWTESLLREYSDFIDWDLANVMIGQAETEHWKAKYENLKQRAFNAYQELKEEIEKLKRAKEEDKK